MVIGSCLAKVNLVGDEKKILEDHFTFKIINLTE